MNQSYINRDLEATIRETARYFPVITVTDHDSLYSSHS